jgi:hypothetical protein
MTTAEFKAWTAVTKGSPFSWKIDTIQWHEYRELLFYFGDEDGKFIWIYSDGMLHAGTYESAIPDLMGATFQPTFAKKFVTREDAHKRVVECGGGQFLFSNLLVALELRTEFP